MDVVERRLDQPQRLRVQRAVDDAPRHRAHLEGHPRARDRRQHRVVGDAARPLDDAHRRVERLEVGGDRVRERVVRRHQQRHARRRRRVVQVEEEVGRRRRAALRAEERVELDRAARLERRAARAQARQREAAVEILLDVAQIPLDRLGVRVHHRRGERRPLRHARRLQEVARQHDAVRLVAVRAARDEDALYGRVDGWADGVRGDGFAHRWASRAASPGVAGRRERRRHEKSAISSWRAREPRRTRARLHKI